MNSIFQALILFLVFYFNFYSFGNIFIRKLRFNNPGFSFILSLFIGISINVSIIYFLGLIFGIKSYFLSYLFLLFGILNIRPSLNSFRDFLSLIKKEKFYYLTLLFFSLIYSSTVFLSGIKINNQLYFQEFHDSVWHLALINNLKNSFPPVHPSSFLFDLKNYHYFYDLLIAIISRNYFLNVSVLYFQFFNLFISISLGLSAYLFGRKIITKQIGLLLVFFIFFAGSFAYLIPFFIKGNSWGESSFWVSQTFGTLVNPQLIYSFSLLFIILTLILYLEKKLKNSIFIHLIISFLIASSMGFKSYAFLVYACLYSFYLLFSFIQNKNKNNLIALLILVVISLPFYFTLSSVGKSPFFYQALWYIDTMVEAPDRLNKVEWKLAEDTYRFMGNNFGVLRIKIREIIIFYLGNLGIRFLFILFLGKILKFKSRLTISIFITLIISSVFPLLFLQTGVVWNSIQFWYYVLILADILISLSLYYFLKNKRIYFQIIIIFLIFILAIPTFVKHYIGKISNYKQKSYAETILFRQIGNNQKVLICPGDHDLYKTSYLSAYTAAQNYLANPTQLNIIDIDFQQLEQNLIQIFDANKKTELNDLVLQNKINYIVCDKPEYEDFIKNLNSQPNLIYQNLIIKSVNN